MTPRSFRLIPLVLVVALLAFSVRVGEVISGFRNMSGAAVAEEKAKAPAEKPAKSEKESKKPDEKSADSSGKDKDKPDTKKESASKSWPDPTDQDPELANVRDGLAKDLAERRKIIEEQEKALSTREAILKAGQEELDQKYRELSELRKQLENLLGQQSEEETARLKSLVRIYEGMKPSDAARIFNTLDMSVLLDVLTNMSERKSAPVLAAMDPERARLVTIMMAQQKKLPELPTINKESSSQNTP